MAQKQFKIGLSNTDKQNMAQDVYERVLALTFAEYDSANTYNEGDFVVYDDTLYQCKQDNTTGAWDSSKWQQATLQDLLNDIEGAVAFVNDKANVDGNYPTMTVGAADNLTPYDEDSGVDQEQPFLLQGTGCGNGEQQVDTGALGLLKEKQGHSVVVNQLVPNDKMNYSITNHVVGNPEFQTICNINAIENHKYLIYCKPNNDLSNGKGQFYWSGTTVSVYDLDLFNILLQTVTEIVEFKVALYGSYEQTTFSANVFVVDLTQMFGSNDNIPAHLLSHPEDFFRYYQGSLAYNEGTLVNANGRYLKAIGRNQWDEEISENYYYAPNGTKTATPNYDACANKIKVIPNATYHYQSNDDGSYGTVIYIRFFDINGNCLNNDEQGIPLAPNNTFVVPSNAVEMVFYSGFQQHFGSNPKITISIYYEGESGYDQYYPYEELANIDTGTEVLRSAGSVKDTKAPDGTITRRVGTQDLSQLSWSLDEGDGYWFWRATWIAGQKVYTGGATQRDCISNNYQASSQNNIGLKDNEVSWGANTLYIRTNDKTTQPSGTLFYALEEPTTEQGTTFSENVAIDDFGSMDFGGTNGVPQGASIFYAVDYKAFIDSLYNTLDGDATDIVKESELDSKLATLGYVKLTSVSGYDATKTQVLKNVEGTLTWVTEE